MKQILKHDKKDYRTLAFLRDDNTDFHNIIVTQYVRVDFYTNKRVVVWQPAEVSFASGNLDTTEARLFAEALTEAIRIAAQWDAERAGQVVELAAQ